MHCNLRPPNAAPVLIRFNDDAHAKFEVAQPIRCCLIAFLLRIRYVMLWPFLWPWPWTLVVCWLCRGQTLYQIWVQSSNPRRSYCDFNIWSNDLEHVSRVALGFEIIFNKFELCQSCLTYIVFLLLVRCIRCDLDLWSHNLESLWYIVCHVVMVCSKFERNRTIFGWDIGNLAKFPPPYVTLWHWPLTPWPLKFMVDRVSQDQSVV